MDPVFRGIPNEQPSNERDADYDVQCGRGAHGNHNDGNKRLKALVKYLLPNYFKLPDTGNKKREFAWTAVLERVQAAGGKFLGENMATKQHDVPIGDQAATTKIMQLFRDEKRKLKKVSISQVAQVSINRKRTYLYGYSLIRIPLRNRPLNKFLVNDEWRP